MALTHNIAGELIDTGKQDVLDSLQLAKLGTVEGDINPNIARNAKGVTAVYFARNLSASIKRRVPGKTVTIGRNYDDPAVKKYHGGMDGEEVRRQSIHRDMSVYEVKVVPVRKVLKFNNALIEIPVDGTEVSIPEGLWDHHLGNYERVRSEDTLVRSEEYTRLSYRWTETSPNPVFESGTDRPTDSEDRPTAYIEFRRQEIHVQQATQDQTRVYAAEGVEV
jgi:hypothetical protein